MIEISQQYILWKIIISASFVVASEVPQGPHLGLLLFSIFNNDVANCFKFSKINTNLKIYEVILTVLKCIELQRDLDAKHCKYLNSKLNIHKCDCISFIRNISILEFYYLLNAESIKRVSQVRLFSIP